MNYATKRYLDELLNLLTLSKVDFQRLRNDLAGEIRERCGENPTTDQIAQSFGTPETWANELTESGDVSPATFSPNHIDWKSKASIGGVPLIHIVHGTRNGKPLVARGIVALGDVAVGIVALGGIAVGGLTTGGASLGLFSIGGLALGILAACGGCAIAPLAFGGFALGIVALGGFSVGWLAAGGFVVGHTAIGGSVYAIEGFGAQMSVQTVLEQGNWFRDLLEPQGRFISWILLGNFLIFGWIALYLLFYFCSIFFLRKRGSSKKS